VSYRRRRGLGGGPRGERGGGGSGAEPDPGAGSAAGGAGPGGGSRGGAPASGGPVAAGRAWARRALPLVVLAIFFGGGYLLASEWLFPGSGSVAAGPVVRVPDLVGLTTGEARRSLESAGLEFRLRSEMPHPRAPEGAVLAQSPLPGQYARPGAPVAVSLSLGPEERRVPDLRGLSGRQGRIVLEGLGFRVEVDSADSPADPGRVVGSRPEAGEPVTLPGAVTLVLSRGPRVAEVPELVGRHVEDAGRILDEAGLRLGEVSYDPQAFAAQGRVIGQSPTPGYALRRGGRVSIQVAGVPPAADTLRADTLPVGPPRASGGAPGPSRR